MTWPQVVWGLTLLVTLVGQWFDMRFGIKENTREIRENTVELVKIGQQVVNNSERIMRLENGIVTEHAKTREEVENAERTSRVEGKKTREAVQELEKH